MQDATLNPLTCDNQPRGRIFAEIFSQYDDTLNGKEEFCGSLYVCLRGFLTKLPVSSPKTSVLRVHHRLIMQLDKGDREKTRSRRTSCPPNSKRNQQWTPVVCVVPIYFDSEVFRHDAGSTQLLEWLY